MIIISSLWPHSHTLRNIGDVRSQLYLPCCRVWRKFPRQISWQGFLIGETLSISVFSPNQTFIYIKVPKALRNTLRKILLRKINMHNSLKWRPCESLTASNDLSSIDDNTQKLLNYIDFTKTFLGARKTLMWKSKCSPI
jgi:hypothetical protein